MSLTASHFIRAREALVGLGRGQTMTEYVLVVTAIAIAVFGAYMLLGQDLSSMVSGADSTLTSA